MQQVDPSAFVAPGVQLYGAIEIGARSSLWPNAVIRAEAHRVSLGPVSNLQDFGMVHIGYDHPTTIASVVNNRP